MDNPILAKWASAIGGRERLQNAKSVCIRSAIKALGLDGTLAEWITADGCYRQEVDLGDGVYRSVKIYNARERRGWTIDQNGQIQELTGPGLKEPITAAYLGSFSHLVPDRMPGRSESIASPGDEGGHVVEVIPDGGAPSRYVIDSASFLPQRMEQRAGDLTRTVRFDRWSDVGGIKFPFRMNESTEMENSEFDITVDELVVNQPFDGDLFDVPLEAAPDYRFVTGTGARDIPLDRNWNHIFVQTQINDSDPVWMLVDTGAQVSVIDEALAVSLGIERHGSFRGRGAGEASTAASLAKGVTLRLQGLELANQLVGILPLGDLGRFLGRPIAGILGQNFLARFVVEIDYGAGCLHVHDPKSFEYKGTGEVVPLTFNAGIPMARAAIKPFGHAPIEADFVIDTGASDAVYLTTPFVEDHDLLATLIENVRMPVTGIGGDSAQNVGRIEQITMGAVTIQNPVTFFSHDARGAFANPDFAGVIGAEVLRRFRVFFDYSAMRMILERNDHFDEPYEFDKAGLVIVAEAEDYKRFCVRAVLDDSPAAEAGILPGDVILSVDGTPAEALTLVGIVEMFYKDGRSLRLCVERDGNAMDIELALRRLV